MSAEPEVWRMRVELDRDLSAPVWPEGVSLRSFEAGDAQRLHALLAHGYRHGGGSVDPFELWLPQLAEDDEFDPEVCFLAEAEHELAGAAICWTSAFVKDLVVHESWRGRGLGEALLRHAFLTFRRRGAERMDLKVQSPNLGAIRLYERVGMRIVERLPAG